jgi:hypothetical protein
MTIFYADFTSGNNYYGGTSFNVLASGSNGRITGSTFSCATGNFPDDNSLIGQHVSIYNGTTDGDFSGFVNYVITGYISTTSLSIQAIPNGSGLANQASDRVFYIGGRWFDPWNVPSSGGNSAIRVLNTTEPGDTIRIMKSPDPVEAGSFTWESLPSTGVGRFPIATGITGASDVEIRISGAHDYNTGDYISISAQGNNNYVDAGPFFITVTSSSGFTLNQTSGAGLASISTGVSSYAIKMNAGLVTIPSSIVVRLTDNKPLPINTGNPNWIANTGITTTVSQYSFSDTFNVSGAFVTGKVAYKTFSPALDLSSYQQVSFLAVNKVSAQNIGGWGSGDALQLALCSDASGNTPVHTINIDAFQGLLSNPAPWAQIYSKNFGSGLSSSIGSLAIYVNKDLGATTNSFRILNVIAAKSPASGGITHASLISKNTAGEPWFSVKYIFENKVALGRPGIERLNTPSPYVGVSETITSYIREAFPIRSSGIISGLIGILLQGGWDSTNMTTRTGETFVDGRYTLMLVSGASSSYIPGVLNAPQTTGSFTQYISPVRSNLQASNVSKELWQDSGKIIVNNIVTAPPLDTAGGTLISSGSVFLPSYSGSFDPVPCVVGTLSNALGFVLGNFNNALTQNRPIPTGNVTITGRLVNALLGGFSQPLYAYSLIGSGSNASFNSNVEYEGAASFMQSANGQTVYMEKFNFPLSIRGTSPTFLKNCTFSEGATLTHSGVNAFKTTAFTQTESQIVTTYGKITTAIDQRKTASGVSWKFQPINTSGVTSGNPLSLSLAKFACASGGQITVSVYARRDSTGITAGLYCKGNQISGVSEDVITYASGSIDTWEQLTINFTPTQAGVVEVQGIAYGGSTNNAWFDDISILQE